VTRKKYNRKYDKATYEKKLQKFGLTDQNLLAEAKSFRKMRRELIHEKAVEFTDLTADTIRIAQDDAKKVLSFVKRVARELGQGDVAPAS
jgi:hypothetical protein